MTRTKAEKQIKKTLDNLPVVFGVNDLYKAFIGMTNIEKAREEDFVLREVMRGKKKNEIINVLKVKHPDMKFNYDDLEKFLARHKEIVQAMGKEVSLSAKRHLTAKAECSEMLAGLALYTQKLIQDFNNEGDHTNTVGAIRALNTTLENYMKLEGMIGTQQEGGKVVNIINTISDRHKGVADRVHSANFTVVDDDDGKV